MSGSPKKPWEHAKSGGSEHDALAARFVESLSYDTRLYKHDIAGSQAHAKMLRHVDLLTVEEYVAIKQGLEQIESEIDAQGNQWAGWRRELEDVHMCIEAALIAKIGEPGKKLHTGRSRNDQVALDLRLWLQTAYVELHAHLRTVQNAFFDKAEEQGEMVFPSYTHLQRAQPIVLGAELLAWATMLDRSCDRLEPRCYLLTCGNYDGPMPLGSGAIAGSALPLDHLYISQNILPFWVADNSIELTASRDAAIDFVYACSMIAMQLSRWAEQWIIYMTTEFGFLTIGEAFTTGSSMMPQKRNPDMLELIRGRCGGVYGHLVALLTICKGLPIGYNRDLQEDKRHVFAAYDTVRDCLKMAAAIVRSAKFNEERIKRDIDKGFLDATSLAEYLVTKGVPFRTAHQHVGALVRHCMDKGIVKLADLSVDDMKKITGCSALGQDVGEWLGAENVVKRYQTYGNAGLSGYREQLKAWKDRLNPGSTTP